MSTSERIGFLDAYDKAVMLWDKDNYTWLPVPDNSVSLGSTTKRLLLNTYRPVVSIANWVGGTAVASTATETSLLTGATVKGVGTAGTIAAGNINRIGAELRFVASGVIANTSTPNLTMKFKLGSDITVATAVTATAAITGTTSWRLEVVLTVLTTGATGTCRAQGKFTYQTAGNAAVTWDLTDGGAITADFTVAKATAFTATWGTSSSSNTIALTNANLQLTA